MKNWTFKFYLLPCCNCGDVLSLVTQCALSIPNAATWKLKFQWFLFNIMSFKKRKSPAHYCILVLNGLQWVFECRFQFISAFISDLSVISSWHASYFWHRRTNTRMWVCEFRPAGLSSIFVSPLYCLISQ